MFQEYPYGKAYRGRNADEVDVGCDIEDNGHIDINLGHSGLAII